jgi:hypothetical protein
MQSEVAMSDGMGQLSFNSPRSFSSILSSLTVPAGSLATLVLVICCCLISKVAVSHLWLTIAAVGLIPLVVGASWAFGARPFAVFGLVFSSWSQLVHHFIYRPYIGASDGLTIELTDIWTIWLLILCAVEYQRGTTKTVLGLRAFLAPLALLLMADILSLVNSADMELSVYGILTHLRVAALFVVLVLALALGKQELHAARVAIVCSVLTMGGICVVEMITHVNIPRNAALIAEAGESDFRAGGISSPTLAAALLATLLPVVAIEYFFPHSRARKILAGLAICAGLAGIGCTLTRAAAGLLAFASIPLMVFLFRKNRIKVTHILACCVLLALLGVGLKDKISERVDEGTDNLMARVGLLGTALNMAAHSPLVGEGVNNYELKMNGFIPSGQRQKFEYVVHNKFFLTLAETGIIGLGAFVWFLVIAFHRAIFLARRGLPMGVGILCSMIVFVFEMNVESYDSGMNLLFSFILMALVAVMWSSENVKAQQQGGVPIGSTGRMVDTRLRTESVVLSWKE